MKFSLIVATIGRVAELERLMQSLWRQTFSQFEVIVVDQNEDQRLFQPIATYSERLRVRHIRLDSRGVSRARNYGAKAAMGEIVAFPDDDCWYDETLLERANDFFGRHIAFDGLTGPAVDHHGRPSIGRWDKKPGEINRYNEWTRSIEFSIFIRASTFLKLKGFNEAMGPGAGTKWGANEGDDLILRSLANGGRYYYRPDFCVFHPAPPATYNDNSLAKAQAYGMGMGHVLKVHRFPWWFVSYYLVRPALGATLSIIRGDFSKAKYYWAMLKGRFLGWTWQ